MTAYERTIEMSVARLRGGEQRFEAALAEAGRWVALLRAALAEITVHVAGASADAVLLIDGVRGDALKPAADGESELRLWHEPGTIVVTVRSREGVEKTRNVSASAGAAMSVILDLENAPRAARSGSRAPAPAPVPPPLAPTAPAVSSGPPAATFVAGGIGVLGVGAFAVFGSLALSKNGELDACGTHCPESLRPEATAGKRDQIIADIGLGVGIAGVATAVLVWALAPKSQPAAASRAVLEVAPPDARRGLGARLRF
jgi:hypothetical protein